MSGLDLLTLALTGLLAFLGAFTLDRLTERKGLTPPGFREPWRRWAALLVVALLFWIGVTAPLSALGKPAAEPDLSTISTPQLFLLHVLMVATLLSWFALGFLGVRMAPPPRPPEPVPAAGEAGWGAPEDAVFPYEPPAPELEPAPPRPLQTLPPEVSLARQLAAQFGFVAQDLPRELGIGLLLGAGAWVVVLAGIMLIGLLLYALGADALVPKEPPALIPFIAGLPIWVKVLISLSAGVVEEWFFRGFLQPRMGLLLSTALFALAHFAYGQPFMLIGITLLSLIYGLLVRWRQNIWPAIAAHALFDGVQLLVVVPGALRLLEGQGHKAAAFLGFC
ncbi:MAG TPA: CPBP family intramembrane glutamic endopeptidase [Thermoanaerobaculia bacterium]|nr:CPBP family intramembrane glutamic endopeptidase [Thermoanaerobaculia bacterium]